MDETDRQVAEQTAPQAAPQTERPVAQVAETSVGKESELGEPELGRRLASKFSAFGPAYMKWVGLQMRASGVTYPRMRLIGALQMSDVPRTMSDLGEELGVTPRNVTKLVDALEEEGLVRRKPHPTDRRSTVIELTDKGVQTAANTFEEHLAAIGTLFERLSEDEQRELLRLLDVLNAELQGKGI